MTGVQTCALPILERLRGSRKRTKPCDKQSDLFANADASTASDDNPSETEASGGRTHDLAEGLTLTDDERILGSILEEDEAAERKRQIGRAAGREREWGRGGGGALRKEGA